LLLLWLGLGQSLMDFPDFFTGSMEITAGYSEAMARQANRPAVELPGYIIGCAVLLLAALFVAPGMRSGKDLRRTLVLLCFTIAICGVTLKRGFVRHDSHASSAFSTLTLLALGIGFTALVDGRRLAANIAFITYAFAMVCHAHGDGWDRQEFLPKGQMLNVMKVALGKVPPPWKDLDARFEKAKQDIITREPLPSLEGSVDIISYNQGLLFAHGLLWKPRPVFQSYSCYTPKLIELNGTALEREGPANLLFRVQPIDNRIATQEDSMIWRRILEWYSVAGKPSDFLHLKRRPTALPWVSEEIAAGTARIGELIDLPDTPPGSVLWISIDMKSTFADRLRSLLFKPQETYIITNGPRGASRNRYLVSAGQTGFIISPRIQSIDDLEALLTGQLPPDGDVRHFSLEQEQGSASRQYSYHLSMVRKP